MTTRTKMPRTKGLTTRTMTPREKIRAMVGRSDDLDLLEQGERADHGSLDSSALEEEMNKGFSLLILLFGPDYGRKIQRNPNDERAHAQAESWMAHVFSRAENFAHFVEYLDETQQKLLALPADIEMLPIYADALRGTLKLVDLALHQRACYERDDEPFEASVLDALPALAERLKGALVQHEQRMLLQASMMHGPLFR